MNELARLNLAASDSAKATFLANISHELRSPLHGILGSIEFLHDTQMDDFQSAMVIAVETCGKSLLDTVNHVLDFAKLNSLAKRNSRFGLMADSPRGLHEPSPESSLTEEFDLAIVTEESVEAVFAGQVFRTANPDATTSASPAKNLSDSSVKHAQKEGSKPARDSEPIMPVQLTLKIDDRDWTVRSQPGAVRRIVMNLLGNSLKYTERGSIHISLESGKARKHDSHVQACLTVTDTGKGMSEDFVRNHAFTAFTQEDSLASGTGLGLSIIRQIVDSLGGKIDLRSQKNLGTEIKIWLSLPSGKQLEESSQILAKGKLAQVRDETKGTSGCLLRPKIKDQNKQPETQGLREMPSVYVSIKSLLGEWFDMKVFDSPNMDNVVADFFIYPEPPPIEYLFKTHDLRASEVEVPIIIVATNAFEAANLRSDGIHHLSSIGRIIEIIAQPCGPRKFAQVLHRCLKRSNELKRREAGGSAIQLDNVAEHRDNAQDVAQPRNEQSLTKDHQKEAFSTSAPVIAVRSKMPSRGTPNKAVSHLSEMPTISRKHSLNDTTPADDTLPRILVVDDNQINLQLLVAFVRKTKHPHESAVNGLAALEAYKRSALANDEQRQRRFKYILMDINMPVMNGMTATQEIRAFEKANQIIPPAIIIAFTGLGSESMTHEDALHCGFDHFLSKPVKFGDLSKMIV